MIEQISEFWRSQTSRLMLVYLLIIMVMSVSYSAVIYIASASQLERRMPNESLIEFDGQFLQSPRLSEYLQRLAAQGKQELAVQLYVLNLVMLIFGTAFSFMLARWTLEPIERNVESQTRFVSDASHELRTPLTAIQTSNEVALRKKKLSISEARHVIEQNLADVERLQRLTTTMLELVADDQPLNRQPTRVHDIVAGSLTDIAPFAIERNITIDDQTKNKLVLADAASATQALTILLDNAVKYSPTGGVVELATKKVRRGTWAIVVTDNGPGIAKEEQKKIFTRFYRGDQARSRTKDVAGGYGLGLEIAQMIAKRHGGSIELRSTLGKGSTFSLVLPSARDSANGGASR